MSGLPKANETVQWTVSSEERAELERAAGGRRLPRATATIQWTVARDLFAELR